MQKTKCIGITGNIGSGKSTVAALLAQKGAELIDADVLAKAASETSSILERIATSLGPEFIQDGQLKRRELAAYIFDKPEARQKLNGIIHPWVREKMTERLNALKSQDPPPSLILLDIPLLYENNLQEGLDAVVVVNAPLDLRIKRVRARSHLTEADIIARDKAQLALEEKIKRADFVVNNDSTLDLLEKQLTDLWPKLLA